MFFLFILIFIFDQQDIQGLVNHSDRHLAAFDPLLTSVEMRLRYLCLDGNHYKGTKDVCGAAAACLHTNIWTEEEEEEKRPGEQQPVDANPDKPCQPAPIVPKGNYVFIFGGESQGRPTDQLLIYNLDSLEWLAKMPKMHLRDAANLRKHTEETRGRRHWHSLQNKYMAVSWMQRAGELRAQRLQGTDDRSPDARHSHSLIATPDGTRLILFGGEGEKSVQSQPVYRARLTAGEKRQTNALSVGAQSMKGKEHITPQGDIFQESEKVLRTFYSDLQVYIVKENRWVDVRRQLPTRYTLQGADDIDDNLSRLWPSHRAGHTMCMLKSSPISKDTGDLNSGLTLREMKYADKIRSGAGGILVLFGGMEKTEDVQVYGPAHDPVQNVAGSQVRSYTGTPTNTNSTWIFDMRTLSWQQLHPSGTPPPGTAYHSAETTDDGNSMFVFGGQTDFGYNTAALHHLKRVIIGSNADPPNVNNPKIGSKKSKTENEKNAKKKMPTTRNDKNPNLQDMNLGKSGNSDVKTFWVWSRVQLLPMSEWSPSPRKCASMTLHPSDLHVLLIYGGNTTSSPDEMDGPSAPKSIRNACNADLVWCFSMKKMKWEKPQTAKNGPDRFVGGTMVSCKPLKYIWAWGGDSGGMNDETHANRDSCFLLKMERKTANSKANASLHFNISLNDPISEGKLQLPPIMGAISEEKQAKLLSFKSQRDHHASALKRLCRTPSVRNYQTTINLVKKIRISRRKMLSASQSMSDLICGKKESNTNANSNDNSQSRTNSSCSQESLEKNSILPDIKATAVTALPHSKVLHKVEDSNIEKSSLQPNSKALSKLPRSHTAPAPFVAASFRREFFDFEINYIASPPLSKNVRLIPLKTDAKALIEKTDAEEYTKTKLETAFDGAVVH